jgi:hypothetical protein
MAKNAPCSGRNLGLFNENISSKEEGNKNLTFWAF